MSTTYHGTVPVGAARTPTGLWHALGSPPLGRRVPGTVPVALAAMAFMTVVCLVVVPTGANLWYADALSHLTVARRLADSMLPGFQQLGTVWLPVPHLLLMPFVQTMWLWSTGWAGAILGILCFGGSCAALYRICARLGLSRGGRLTALLVLACCPDFVYLHTTALTEPVLFVSILGTVAGLVHWATAARPLSGGELAVFAGIPAAAGILTRYEGWVLTIGMVIFVTVVESRRSRGRVTRLWRFVVLRRVLPALAAPIAAGSWWLAYNYNMFGDPLDFMFGPYSAYAQQQVAVEQGTLTTADHFGLSLYVYNRAVWDLLGPVVTLGGVLGLLVCIARHGLGLITLTLGLLFGTYCFEIASLYLGQTIMLTPHSLPPGLFNVRYGLAAFPFFALGTAVVFETLRQVRRGPLTVAALVPVLLLARPLWVLADPTERSPMLVEGRSLDAGRPNQAAAYLRDHYDGGGILMDESVASNGIIPLVRVPVKEWYLRASGDYYTAALEQPAKYARWILVATDRGGLSLDTADQVYAQMLEHPELFTAYAPVYEGEGHAIYRRSDS
ncbi:ArnT family glycosyltransferase [Nocardioides sp.]|uniref:ArnT family glycosyltransferase n=1 Tax=Nocardioides sp. TaxID=35761 RepID=UPI0039E50E08